MENFRGSPSIRRVACAFFSMSCLLSRLFSTIYILILTAHVCFFSAKYRKQMFFCNKLIIPNKIGEFFLRLCYKLFGKAQVSITYQIRLDLRNLNFKSVLNLKIKTKCFESAVKILRLI